MTVVQASESAQPPAPETPAPAAPARAAQDGECESGLQVQMKIRGETRLKKFDSLLKIGPGLFDGKVCDSGGEWANLVGKQTLPPVDGYFVAFRFVPVTNTTAFEEVGKTKGKAKIVLPYADIDLTTRLTLRVSNVKQDGVRIDVGGHCRTAEPAAIRLKGRVRLEEGSESEIKTVYTIPPFTGCGAAEDLDPLMTGLVSGPGNQLTVRLTSCGVGQECPKD